MAARWGRLTQELQDKACGVLRPCAWPSSSVRQRNPGLPVKFPLMEEEPVAGAAVAQKWKLSDAALELEEDALIVTYDKYARPRLAALRIPLAALRSVELITLPDAVVRLNIAGDDY